MQKAMTRLAFAAVSVLAISGAARAQDVTFLSTQLRPIEEAQKVRSVILKDFPGKVNYVTEEPAKLNIRVQAEQQAGAKTAAVIGALHGEIAGLPMESLQPVDDILKALDGRGIPKSFTDLGKLGTDKQIYVPWMQATYIMAANKEALKHLPAGAKLESLTYDQLKDWAANVQKATGQRKLGFPAGPKGLLARFFQGYFYPSFTGGVVSTFKSAEAEAGWAYLKDLWQHTNPASTGYDFMQEPLLTGEVWIAWDHVARLLDALKQKPDQFVAFPVPAGPKGRGFMPVVAGLSVMKGAAGAAGAQQLIAYMTDPKVQALVAKEMGFFPVVKADLPADAPEGVRLAAAAIAGQSQAPDALVSLLPVGLGAKGGEFNQVYVDAFKRIILQNQPIKASLDIQAKALAAIIAETKAPCWAPDKASTGPCPVN